MMNLNEALNSIKNEKILHRKYLTQRYLSSYRLKPEERYEKNLTSYIDIISSFCNKANIRFDPSLIRTHLLSGYKYPFEGIIRLFSTIDLNDEKIRAIADCLFDIYKVHNGFTGLNNSTLLKELKNTFFEVVKYITDLFKEKPFFLSIEGNKFEATGIIPDFFKTNPTLVFDSLPIFHPFIGSNTLLTMTCCSKEEYAMIRDVNRFRIYNDFLIQEIPHEFRRPLLDREMALYIKSKEPLLVLDYVEYVNHLSNHFLISKGIRRPLMHGESAERYVQEFIRMAKESLAKIGIEGSVNSANIAISSDGRMVLTSFSSLIPTIEALREIGLISIRNVPKETK